MVAEQGPGIDRFVSRRAARLPRICSKITAERAEAVRLSGRDVLSLKPYPVVPLPEHVLEAADRAARENQAVPGTGALRLRDAIAAKLERETGWRLDPQREIVVTNGAMQALNIIFRTVLDPGDEVIYPAPGYFFYGAIDLAGGVAVPVPTDEAKGWVWDLDAIERAITPRTKILVVHSPTNPTGRVLSAAELQGLAEISERRAVLLLYDESYDRLVYDGLQHRSPASLDWVRRRLVVVQSVTKSYAMSPWRVGYIAAPRRLAEEFGRLLEWEVLMCSHVGQAAAEAAIAGPGDWLREIPLRFAQQRDLIWSALHDVRGLAVRKPEGSPFLFPNVSRLGVSGDEFWRILLDDYGVPTEPGSFFKSPHHVRLSFGAPLDVLAEVGRRVSLAAAQALDRVGESN